MNFTNEFIPEPLPRFASFSSALCANTLKLSAHFSLQKIPPDFTILHSVHSGLPHCLHLATEGLPV